MAKKALYEKAKRKNKFKVREYHRCPICGRARGYMGKFDLCRICFRKMAQVGQIPGIIKSSW